MPEQNAPQTSLLGDECRDPGLSNAIWQQLEVEERLAEERAKLLSQAIREREEARERGQEAEEQAKRESASLRELEIKNQAGAVELLREREEARTREIEAGVEEAKEEARKVAPALREKHARIAAKARELLRHVKRLASARLRHALRGKESSERSRG